MAPDPSPEKRALLEAYDAAIQRKNDEPASPPPARRRLMHPVTALCLLVLVAIGVWIAAARPAWLLARGFPTETGPVREASLRLAMALQYQRIEQFRDSAGHLPERLDQTGPSLGDLTYTTTQFGGFVLEGTDSTVRLTLRSEDSLATFVGDSYEIVSRRGAP